MKNRNEIQVRFANDEDFSACMQLEPDPLAPEIIRRKIGLNEIIIAVATTGTVGYLRLDYLWSKFPYVSLIVVQSECRRQGVGRAMLGFLEAFLKREGHALLLSSSQSDEPSAQRWHRDMGFQECGVLRGINENAADEIFFRKTLT